MQLASAQTQSNLQTAGAQANLNNINTFSPYGSSTYQPFYDPATGNTAGFNLNQVLNPQYQKLMQTQADLAQTLAGQGPATVAQGAGLAGQGANLVGLGANIAPSISGDLASYLQGEASPVSLTPSSFQTNITGGAGGQAIPQVQTGIPGAGVGIQTTLPGAGQGVQGAVGPSGPIQTNLSPQDFGTQIKQAQDAAYKSQTQYLDPQFKQQEESLTQRLADQGIQEGSDAHTRAMGDFNRQKQMAYQSAQDSATEHGNALQQQLFGQQLQSGQFANAAQAQQYVQQLQDAGFVNAAQAQTFNQQAQAATYGLGAQQQGFAQQAAAGQFANQAQQQVFGQGQSLADLYNQAVLGAAGTTNQAAALGLQRAQAEQQAPINAMQALLSGGAGVYGQGLTGMQSVLPSINAAPTWAESIPTMGGTPTNISPTNYAAATQAATQANQLAYQSGQTNLGNMLGFGDLGSKLLTGKGLGSLFGGGGLLGLL